MKCKCKRKACAHKWETRGDKEPKACPACKSYKWNKEEGKKK